MFKHPAVSYNQNLRFQIGPGSGAPSQEIPYDDARGRFVHPSYWSGPQHVRVARGLFHVLW